jgi:hypothetical protein
VKSIYWGGSGTAFDYFSTQGNFRTLPFRNCLFSLIRVVTVYSIPVYILALGSDDGVSVILRVL